MDGIDGDYFIHIKLSNLEIEVTCNDTSRDLDVGKETLDELLQSTIDAATTGPSDLNGLILLQASLLRWSAYARRARKLLEREMMRPGYLAELDA